MWRIEFYGRKLLWRIGGLLCWHGSLRVQLLYMKAERKGWDKGYSAWFRTRTHGNDI